MGIYVLQALSYRSECKLLFACRADRRIRNACCHDRPRWNIRAPVTPGDGCPPRVEGDTGSKTMNVWFDGRNVDAQQRRGNAGRYIRRAAGFAIVGAGALIGMVRLAAWLSSAT